MYLVPKITAVGLTLRSYLLLLLFFECFAKKVITWSPLSYQLSLNVNLLSHATDSNGARKIHVPSYKIH